MVIAHAPSLYSDHFREALAEFWWPEISANAHAFVLSSHPVPLGETRRNEVLHVDYLYMKQAAKNANTCLLVLKDELTGFVDLPSPRGLYTAWAIM
jgi:hypothetical protein